MNNHLRKDIRNKHKACNECKKELISKKCYVIVVKSHWDKDKISKHPLYEA